MENEDKQYQHDLNEQFNTALKSIHSSMRLMLEAIERQQKQIESLSRLSALNTSMLKLMMGDIEPDPTASKVRELTDAAAKEIDDLKKLWERDSPDSPGIEKED